MEEFNIDNFVKYGVATVGLAILGVWLYFASLYVYVWLILRDEGFNRDMNERCFCGSHEFISNPSGDLVKDRKREKNTPEATGEIPQ